MKNFKLPNWVLPIAAIVTGISAAVTYLQDNKKSDQVDALIETNKQLVEALKKKEK